MDGLPAFAAAVCVVGDFNVGRRDLSDSKEDLMAEKSEMFSSVSSLDSSAVFLNADETRLFCRDGRKFRLSVDVGDGDGQTGEIGWNTDRVTDLSRVTGAIGGRLKLIEFRNESESLSRVSSIKSLNP